MKRKLIILIDNGHGFNTTGKCSPDGRLREWAWTREVAAMIAAELTQRGYDARLLVTESNDVPLRERTRRVNEICRTAGAGSVLLISVHVNAAGADGCWHNASGWSVFVAPKSSAASKDFARLLYDQAERRGLQGNRSVPPCRYWTGNFAIVRDTRCPAVLTENLFQDNRTDTDYLLSPEGKHAITALHVDAVEAYAKRFDG